MGNLGGSYCLLSLLELVFLVQDIEKVMNSKKNEMITLR